MIKEAVATGATIEEAQSAAVLALDAPVNAEVQFEVISLPEKKVFGIFGGKSAEVRAYYEVPDEEENVTKQKPVKSNSAEKKPKEEKKNNSVNVEKETQKEKKEEKTEKVEEINFEIVTIEVCPESVQKAYKYLNTVISGIGISGVSVEIGKNEKEYLFNITCEEDYSLLIGRRGETLDSIQYLVRLVANKGKNEEDFSKISVNIGNYRQKRETTLKEIAKKTANKVKKYGRSIALDPMNPFERRIIHTEISKIDDVVSYSVGENSERKVIIALAEGVKPTMPRKSYGGRGGYGRGRGGRGGRQSSYSSERTSIEAPSRAPRSDAEGLSRYGKIEPKE